MCCTLQVGLDVAGEAVQRASRKLVAAYKQAADPLSNTLQQWQGLAERGDKLTGGPVSKQLPSSRLFHGDIATANATKPGKCSLNTEFVGLNIVLCFACDFKVLCVVTVMCSISHEVAQLIL